MGVRSQRSFVNMPSPHQGYYSAHFINCSTLHLSGEGKERGREGGEGTGLNAVWQTVVSIWPLVFLSDFSVHFTLLIFSHLF